MNTGSVKQGLSRQTKWFLCLIWTGVVLVSIKSVFTDFGIDNGYAIATSYRHLSGDRMFEEMWEPHQTSAFLVDGLLFLYRLLVPSLTGAALYLQIMGILLWIPVIVILYKELTKHIDRDLSQLICAFLFVFRAKQTVFPEFSNMQIGFSLLFFTFLVKFICRQEKWGYLILSAVFLCLEIISYPTCIIAFAAAVLLLFLYTKDKGKNILIFGGVCLSLGLLYVGCLTWKRGLSELIDVLRLLTEADLSHGEASMTLYQYWHVFGEAAAYAAVTMAAAAAICLCLRKWRKVPFLAVYGGALLVTAAVILLVLMCGGRVGYEWHYCIALFLLILFGGGGYRFLSDTERKIWLSGLLVSLSSFLAVALLTNCALMSVIAYLPLAAGISMIPLAKLKKGSFFAGAVLLFVLLHRGLIVWGYSELSYNSYVNEVESVIRTGPALGIVCDDNMSCFYRDNAVDFEKFLEPQDSLLLVADWGYDPLFYVQADVGVAISSTISSPTYGEKQIGYWDRYPYKLPTVVAIGCYDDTFSLERSLYPMMFEWVEEHYEWVGDGTWWRFYRRKE